MKATRTSLLLLTISSLVTMQAAADELPHSYFGLERGHGHTYLSTDGLDSTIASNKTLRAFSGVSLNQNFAAEFGLVDFGESSSHFTVNDTTVRQQSHAAYISAVLSAPSETVRWFARVGYDWWSASYLTTATIGGTPVYGDGSATGRNFHYGVGMDIPLGNNMFIRVDWQRYKKIGEGVTVSYQSLPSTTMAGSDITVVDAGLVLNF